ncbi:ubiquitin carboxyl-terminal hydrolase 32-like, partial [Dendronephthya gigantea]|uniref:ubiquitin carboxyl-terminal hydrolase 32-like n=1 Tax=Dendronephthya gigantea TaxID=151771 RepID=UPI001069A500
AWDNHLKRNKSIVVDLFQGQLKSCVRCLQCSHISVRFDPYTFLSLPIPMDNSIYVECIVVTLDGSVPIKYGLLLNTDDNYKMLKKQLAKLCSLTPSQLLMAELLGASIKGQPLDSQKVRSSLSGILYAFEIPTPPVVVENSPPNIALVSSGEASENLSTEGCISGHNDNDGCDTNSSDTKRSESHPCDTRRAELVRSPSRSSSERSYSGTLKLPCLSRQTSDDDEDTIEVGSEVSKRNNVGLLKQLSPRFMRKLTGKKSANHWNTTEAGNTTVELSSYSGQPSASVQSTPGHSRNTSISSANSGNSVHTGIHLAGQTCGYLIGLHRKLMRMDVYFIAPQKNRPSLFGCPLIIPCIPGTKNSELYLSVWQQISRFVSVPSPGDELSSNRQNGYPFELKVVTESGLSCALCPWFKFCRGCTIECNDEQFNCNCQYLAIEWEPTTLHLRYQSSQEKVFTEHASVEQSRRLQTEPIDLYECFKAFTKEEELGEDELWYCSKCKKHQLASKKLDIWSLPPILIIHLKRFQFMNGRWVKSNKIVNFPMETFDPSEFVVKRTTTSNVCEDSTFVRTVNVQTAAEEILEHGKESGCPVVLETDCDKNHLISERQHKESSDSGLSSNSSGYSSNESCVVTGGIPDINEDSDCSSQSATEKYSERHLKEGKHPCCAEKHSVDGNSDKVRALDKTSSETRGKNGSSEDCKKDNHYDQAPVKTDFDDTSSCSSSSKTSDVNCVAINSVDTFDVESSGIAEKNVKGDNENDTSRMLYNLYTISSHTGVMGGGHYV